MTSALAVALALGGCDDGGRYGGGGGVYYVPCTQFRTCDQCTPIIGCGWCSYGKGQGICLSAPNECRTAQFSWTWEPAGCGIVAADASVVNGQVDATPEPSTTDDAGAAADAPSGTD